MARDKSKQQDKGGEGREDQSKRDLEMEALGAKLKGYEKDLSNVEAQRNRLVTSHQPGPKVDEMRRDLDGQAADLKDKIKGTHEEMFKLEEERRDTGKEITEHGAHQFEKDLEHIAEGQGHEKGAQGHGKPGADTNAKPADHLPGHQPASHGPQGDFYPPGDWMGKQPPADGKPPSPFPDPDQLHGSVGIQHTDWAHADGHGGATPSPMEALAIQGLVIGSYVHNRFFADKKDQGEQEKTESKPEAQQNEQSSALPAAPDSKPIAQTQGEPQKTENKPEAQQNAQSPTLPATPDSKPMTQTQGEPPKAENKPEAQQNAQPPALPATPDSKPMAQTQNMPSQAPPSLPPTPDMKPAAAAAQPSQEAPAPAMAQDPDR